MGESDCLVVVHPFAYASGRSNDAEQENSLHALGDSISFGRFTSESLSWEKWSTFSHKSYVEEAERYAQPGSVAQKKAFFEAHYKSIAAKKAAALLEQANAVNNNHKTEFIHPSNHSQVLGNSNAELEKMENSKAKVIEGKVPVQYPLKESLYQNESPQKVKPLLEGFSSIPEAPSLISNKKPEFSFPNSAVHQRATRVPVPPAKPAAPLQPRRENIVIPLTKNSTIDSTDKKQVSPNSLHNLIYATPAREQDKSTTLPQRIDSSRVAPSPYKASKDCKTPLSTPMKASANGVLKDPPATPSSEIKRSRTPLDISAPGSKTTGPKWHILSALCSKSFSACRNKLQSPTLSSSFSSKTEERAARRKQLEEKFNAKEQQKVQLQTRLKEKAETELRKLRQSLCFRAQPPPDFYKERETPKDQTKNTSFEHHNSPKLGTGKPNSSPLQGITSLPPETTSTKKSCPNNFLKKISQITNPYAWVTEMISTHENTSPNIQN